MADRCVSGAHGIGFYDGTHHAFLFEKEKGFRHTDHGIGRIDLLPCLQDFCTLIPVSYFYGNKFS